MNKKPCDNCHRHAKELYLTHTAKNRYEYWCKNCINTSDKWIDAVGVDPIMNKPLDGIDTNIGKVMIGIDKARADWDGKI